jgi:hypothetical protein
VLTGVIKALNKTVADAVGGALEAVELGEVEPSAAQGVLDVLYNVGLEGLLVIAQVSEKDVTMRYIGEERRRELLLHQAPKQMVAFFFFCGHE